MTIQKAKFSLIIFFIILVVLTLISVFTLKVSPFLKEKRGNVSSLTGTKTLSQPQISGWVAWWEEPKAYDLIKRHPEWFSSVSPVWFMVDENLQFKEIGINNKNEIVKTLHDLNIKVLPSLGSELTGQELSNFLNDQTKVSILTTDITTNLLRLGVDGLDVDLESIKEADKDKFSYFLRDLADSLKKNKLTLSVTVHAQTSTVEWEGVLGQDLGEIGKITDEIRIMAYDKHSAGTKEGAIAPISWIKEVTRYNSKFIDKDKIVIGIPSYGYVWTSGDSVGLQFNEFQKYIENTSYSKRLDPESGELVFTSDDYIGWLSDSYAMNNKIEAVRELGFNKFVIWHLGGMDENFFEKVWSK